MEEIWQAVKLGERPIIPSYCTIFFKELIESCWQDNPQRRPSFENILKQIQESAPDYSNPQSPLLTTESLRREQTSIHVSLPKYVKYVRLYTGMFKVGYNSDASKYRLYHF